MTTFDLSDQTYIQYNPYICRSLGKYEEERNA